MLNMMCDALVLENTRKYKIPRQKSIVKLCVKIRLSSTRTFQIVKQTNV